MTHDEIARFLEYQKLREQQIIYENFLSEIEDSDEIKFIDVAVVMRERGIAPSNNYIKVPDDLKREICNMINTKVIELIENLTFKIKAL